MLMETLIVTIPAQPELDADQAEYGHLSNKVRALFGEAAAEAGSPDFSVSDLETGIVDAVTNLLHCAQYNGVDIDRTLRVARDHFEAEKDGSE